MVQNDWFGRAVGQQLVYICFLLGPPTTAKPAGVFSALASGFLIFFDAASLC